MNIEINVCGKVCWEIYIQWFLGKPAIIGNWGQL